MYTNITYELKDSGTSCLVSIEAINLASQMIPNCYAGSLTKPSPIHDIGRTEIVSVQKSRHKATTGKSLEIKGCWNIIPNGSQSPTAS